MTCTCHIPNSFCVEHNVYVPSTARAAKTAVNFPAGCTCINPLTYNPSCPVHALKSVFGMRAAPNTPVNEQLAEIFSGGRVIHAEPVMLRPAGAAPLKSQCVCHLYETDGYVAHCPEHGAAPAKLEHAPACGCDMPIIFGHDTGCELHPAPILADPLQLLVAATQLISDQPTTEQWQTIKQAISALVPSPLRK